MGIWIELAFTIGLDDKLPRLREMPADTQCRRRYLLDSGCKYDTVEDIPIVTLADLTAEDQYKNLTVKVGDQWRVASLIPQPVTATVSFEILYFKERVGSLKAVAREMSGMLNRTRYDSLYVSAKVKEPNGNQT